MKYQSQKLPWDIIPGEDWNPLQTVEVHCPRCHQLVAFPVRPEHACYEHEVKTLQAFLGELEEDLKAMHGEDNQVSAYIRNKVEMLRLELEEGE